MIRGRSLFSINVGESLWGDTEEKFQILTEEVQQNWTIELRRGVAKNFKENKNNAISTTRTNALLLIPYALLTYFSKFANLFFLVISILMIADPDMSIYYRWIHAFPLFIYMVLHFLKIFYIHYLRQKEDRKVNALQTRKAQAKLPDFQTVEWKSLKPGDIVYLKRDEICPADLILLDASTPKNRDMICWIDTQALDGFANFTMKKALIATKVDRGSLRKDNYLEYRKILSGKIEYCPPSSESKGISGYIKLKKDPRVEPLTDANFLPRGCIIKNTEWIYGIVAYTGNDTKIMLHPKRTISKGSTFDRLAIKFFLVGFALILLLAIISIGIFEGNYNDKNQMIQYPESLKDRNYLIYVILYSPLLPIAFYVTRDIILLIASYRLSSDKNEKAIKILDPSPLPNLGHIDYCLLDKTGTLTTAKYKVRAVYANSKFYRIDPERLKDFFKTFDRQKTGGSLNYIPEVCEIEPNSQGELSYNPTIQEVGEEPHDQKHTPQKQFKFKQDVEERIRTETSQRLDTDQSLLQQTQTFIKKRDEEKPLNMITEDDEPIDLNKLDDAPVKKNLSDVSSPIRAEKNYSLFSPINQRGASIPLLAAKTGSSAEKIRTMSIIDENFEKHNESDYLKDCHTGVEEELHRFIRALALCHGARSKYSENTDFNRIYESSHPEDLALIELGTLSGKSFQVSNRPDNPSEYTTKHKGEEVKYSILGVNDFSYERKRFSIVAKPVGKDTPAYVYAKGSAVSMKSVLDMTDVEATYYDSCVSRLQKEGYKVIVLAGKELPKEEEDDYYKKYQSCKMSLYSQNEELETLAKTVEQELKWVGIIALEDELRPDASEMVQSLHQAKIKTWLVTGDNQENATNVSYSTNIINEKTHLYHLKFDNAEDGKAVIRNTLTNIKKSLPVIDEESSPTSFHKQFTGTSQGSSTQENPEMAIIFSGDIIDIIWKDAYLQTNFTFLCALSKSVIGYRLSPNHKKLLTLFAKNRLPGSPTVMAIGDGHNDKLMLQCADVGLEFKSDHVIGSLNTGDIQISSLSSVSQLLFVEGRILCEKIEKIIHFAFFKSFVIGGIIFFFNCFSQAVGTLLFDSMFVFLYSFLFTFFPPLVYGISDQSEPKEILLTYPALYLDGKHRKGKAWKNFLIQSLGEGVLNSCIIFWIVTYSVNAALSKEGYTSSLGMSSLVQYYSLIVIVNFKMFGYFKKSKVIWLLSTVASLLSLLVYMFINDAAQFVDSIYLRETQAIFERAGPITSMLFVIAFCGGLNYVILHLIQTKVFHSLYERSAEKYRLQKSQSFKNQDILAITKHRDLRGIIQGVYKRVQIEYVDPSIQEMLHLSDRKYNQLDIGRWTLKFGDPRLERQYKIIMSKLVSKRFKYIYFFFLLVFGGYILGQSILTEEASYTYSRLGVFLGFLVLSVSLFTYQFQTFYFEITFFLTLLVYSAKIAFDWTVQADSTLAAALIPMATTVLFNAHTYWIVAANIVYFVVYAIRLIVLFEVDEKGGYPSDRTFITFYILWSLIVLLGGINAVISALIYKVERQQRGEFVGDTKVKLQLTKTNDILSILLPKFIKEKISRLGNDKSLAEDQGEVAIIFCDIMDFDKIIHYEGKNLVPILDTIFRAFDQLCGAHGAQKIETVGKTYMACAGLKSCEVGVSKKILAIHPTRRLLNLALDMEDFVTRVTYGKGIPLKLRIGLHYGRVIAGVIGYHKPQFSLIGDAVNTTSRVCTVENPGQIRMSEEAYNQMMKAGGAGRNEIFFISKTEEMKGKGKVPIQIVARKASKTDFREKISLALKRNKETEMFSPSNHHFSKLNSLTPHHSTTDKNIYQNVKELLKEKEKVKLELEKIREKEAAQASLEESDKNIPGKMDDYDSDDDDYEDENKLFVKASLLLLDLSSSSKMTKAAFLDQVSRNVRTFSIRTILMLLVLHLIQTSFCIADAYIYSGEFDHIVAIIVLRFIFAIALAAILIAHPRIIRKKNKDILCFAVFTYGMLVAILHASFSERGIYQKIQSIELMLIYIIAIHSGEFDFVQSIIFSGLLVLMFFIAFSVESVLNISNIFHLWIFIFINMSLKYTHFQDEIKFYNNAKMREKRKTEQSGLVGHLLPIHAAEMYFSDPTGRVDVSDEIHDVTILYADIKGFTDYSAAREPKDVVAMLSALFTKFDKVCVQYSLYKVYTIGDCYVALSFYDKSRRDKQQEVKNMVNMALAMLQIIREVRQEIKFDGLDMRIGLHTGTIIGGIVGTDIIRYDVWGRDAIIANKMESEGKQGYINVSESTKNLLEVSFPGEYRFVQNQIVNLEKFQIQVPCYFLYANDQ